MENEQIIHIETAYKKKKVKVHLRFSEGTDDKNAQYLYNILKKNYIEKYKNRAINKDLSALK